ncbi:LuxR C-terminal-related transcriptional regulator [Microbacterium invictum]|uniref:DNA-binding CsgD family transcriptional regulator n=1 Tax=Microbacterium invictum TaxID=515415 RepID=A0AA40SLP9_9MICO|nr:LuxR C-terminal-related transcriptional regulator [Microbacterium invictum]MBB4138551.1 DNA-binding CsgD family transcriptional regulator [Microbacterium invictum]
MGSPVDIDSDTQLVSRAVSDLARDTRFPVVFAGLEHGGAIHVTSIAGARTHSLDGLVVQQGRGLGGAALLEKRPRLALEYRTARSITHDYDRAILGEGIATLLAVPVVVSGRPRGVVYCGSWAPAPVGDLVARPAFRAADTISTELRVREEVQRRIATLTPAEPIPTLPAAAQEDLRESFAELRSIAASLTDDGLRQRIAAVQQRLAAISRDEPDPPAVEVSLSPRELDVIACAALGATNAEIAASLTLREGTVKSYLQSAMSKLDASTRHAAVAKARRAGLLP